MKDHLVCSESFRLSRVDLHQVGIVYRGRSITSRHERAIKVEPYDCVSPQLEHEYYVYCKLQGCVGIPRVYWLGTECEHNIMVLDLLGPSVEDVRIQSGGCLALVIVLRLADELVSNSYYYSVICCRQ